MSEVDSGKADCSFWLFAKICYWSSFFSACETWPFQAKLLLSSVRRIFKRALAKAKKTMMEKKKMSKPPSLQDVKTGIEVSGYRGIFPEMFKLLDILLTIPVAIATVEHSFSLKIVKTCFKIIVLHYK